MANVQYYDVILKPVVTEKSMNAMAEKKYTFLVHPDANKTMIKEAVERMFEGTKVAKVNTMNCEGKNKRRGMVTGKTAKTKKAIVQLTADSKDTGRKPSYYDAIISGDLGYIGKEIVQEMAQSKGYNIKANYNDCGVLMFDKEKQDTHSGGSGCACIATLFSGYFFKQLKEGKLKRILLLATGALMNSTSMQQGETIPGIAHAISIEM